MDGAVFAVVACKFRINYINEVLKIFPASVL